MHEAPETRYAKSGEYHIAYQVVGTGHIDLVFIPGFISNVEHGWEYPPLAHFYRRLASFARLIIFDKRGTGMSDPVPPQQLPTLEERMDDVRAVMDAAGSKRAALVGVSEGGPMSVLFAASYPERTVAMVLIATFARVAWAPDYLLGTKPDVWNALLSRMEEGWGQGVLLSVFAASLAHDSAARQWWGRFQRQASSPGAAVAVMRMVYELDTRSILPAVRVPTLVLHRSEDRLVPVERPRYLAAHIPGAKFVELSGQDHFFFTGDADADPRANRGVSDRRASWRRLRSRARDDPVRRHRRLYRARRAARRLPLARGPRCLLWRRPAPTRSASAAARSTPRATASSLPSTARRARSVARRRSARRPPARPRGARRRPYRRVRGDGRKGRRHRRAHRRARRGASARRRGSRVEHGQGPGGRLRARVRRSRRASR